MGAISARKIKREISEQIISRWPLVVGIFAVLFPLSLLLSVNAGFYVDWENHLWQVGYYGEYFAAHGSLPVTLNTDQAVLVAFPTFYGFWLYSVLGVISSVVGPNLAVRLAIFILWGARFILVYRLSSKFCRDRLICTTLACLISWEIYPLTNLYNRSALTELFAAGLLTCSLCSVFLMILSSQMHAKISYALMTGLTLALAIASHPITALLGAPFLGLVFLVSIPFVMRYRRDNIRFVVITGSVIAIFIALVIAPWTYATLRFAPELKISYGTFGAVIVYSQDIDNLLTRFAPLPFDSRSLFNASIVSTPYLDAQVDVPLLLFIIILVLAGSSNGKLNPNRRSCNCNFYNIA